MGLFCEDIREEKSDIVTLVGILSDNVNLLTTGSDAANSSQLAIVPKICVYVRVNFDPDYDIGQPKARLLLPDGSEVSLGEIGTDVVEKSRADAKQRGSPLAGVLIRAVIAQFATPPGVVRLEVTLGAETYLAAILNLRVEAPIASPQPS